METTPKSSSPAAPPGWLARWPWVLLAVALTIQALGLLTIVTYRTQLGGGVNLAPELDTRLRVTPNTPEAQLQMRGLRHPVRLLEVNEQAAAGLKPDQVQRSLEGVFDYGNLYTRQRVRIKGDNPCLYLGPVQTSAGRDPAKAAHNCKF